MSHSRYARKGDPVRVGVLATIAVLATFSSAFAQSDSTPKWDWFLGYQWMHPGI